MSKMIRVGSCQTCTFCNGWICVRLYNVGKPEYKIDRESKILPNCPLEDYSDSEIKIGKYTITVGQSSFFIKTEDGEGFEFSETHLKEFFDANM